MKPLRALISKKSVNKYKNFDKIRGQHDAIIVIKEENGKDVNFLKKQRYSQWFMIGYYDSFVIPHENIEELFLSGKDKSVFKNTKYNVYDFPSDRFKTLDDFFEWVDNTKMTQVFSELADYYQFNEE